MIGIQVAIDGDTRYVSGRTMIYKTLLDILGAKYNSTNHCYVLTEHMWEQFEPHIFPLTEVELCIEEKFDNILIRERAIEYIMRSPIRDKCELVRIAREILEEDPTNVFGPKFVKLAEERMYRSMVKTDIDIAAQKFAEYILDYGDVGVEALKSFLNLPPGDNINLKMDRPPCKRF